METVINPFTKRIIQSGGRTHQRVLKTLEQMGGDWDLSDCRHFEEIGSSISCYDLIGGVERLWYDQEYSEFTSPISIERNDHLLWVNTHFFDLALRQELTAHWKEIEADIRRAAMPYKDVELVNHGDGAHVYFRLDRDFGGNLVEPLEDTGFEVPQDMMDAAMRVVEVMQDWGFDRKS